ncbi:glycoside hydrolase [Tuber indicum]|nr:glycoside hydrolase [Tuber indicum]
MKIFSPFVANGVYYPNWRIYKNEPPSSLKLGLISHVFYSFAWVKLDGTVYLSDEWADSQIDVDGTKGCLRSFQNLKAKHSHLKVVLSVGGGGKGSDNFAAVAANPASRERFAHTARELVNEYGLDGIDIDWEHPSDHKQGHNYIALLAAIRQHLPSPHYVLTSALPAGEWALRNIDLCNAHQYLDYINLMTYDFSGPWVPQSGHHAQLFSPRHPHNEAARLSADSAVSYVTSKSVPPSKILLGIPAYGRSFLGCHNPGQKYSGSAGKEGTFEYKDLPRPGAIEYTDENLGAAWCVGGDGGWVSYDNPATVKIKAGYARNNRLGGVFFWTGTADGEGSRSLVEASFSRLHTQ